MKYISPGGWFSLEYPITWHEFEDTEESFLFYNPDEWTGNFRISAYKDEADDYGQQCIDYELKENPSSSLVKVGTWECAYSAETFQEEGTWYTTHIWVTGKGNISFECSFTVPKGGCKQEAEEIIKSLQVRKEGVVHPKEIIPIRVMEIGGVNTSFEWASTTVKKLMTKDFTSSEEDLESMQQVMDSGRFQPQQRMAWENFGIAFGTILVNEMDGMEWVTVVDGQNEYPALQFAHSDMVIDPAALVWEKARKELPCDLKSEFRRIKREAEAVLDDLNNK
ncbi:MAG: DUF3805 domain-containing protein [Bacteroides sp.]|nr:DUF3805 domain-containing protein [Bacteroides sp.]